MASAVCCEAGAPVTSDYSPLGSFVTLDQGARAYVIGGDSEHGIILITDIFGLDFNQVHSALLHALSKLEVRFQYSIALDFMRAGTDSPAHARSFRLRTDWLPRSVQQS